MSTFLEEGLWFNQRKYNEELKTRIENSVNVSNTEEPPMSMCLKIVQVSDIICRILWLLGLGINVYNVLEGNLDPLWLLLYCISGLLYLWSKEKIIHLYLINEKKKLRQEVVK